MKLFTYQSLRFFTNNAWPPKRAPHARITPCASGSVISTWARILNERPRTGRGRELGDRKCARVIAIHAALGDIGDGHLGNELGDRTIVERQHVVLAGFDIPEPLEFLHLVRLLAREVVHLGAVDLRVVELPCLVDEVLRVAALLRRALRNDVPAFVPERARAHHLVVLDLLLGRPVGVEAVFHRHTRQRRLRDPWTSSGISSPTHSRIVGTMSTAW